MIHTWIDRCHEGDRQAFASLVGAFQQKIFGLCWQYLRNDQAARDASADIFYKVFTSFDRFDPQRSFPTWLLAIATNHLLQIKRTERRRGTLQEWPDYDLPNDQATPEEELLNVSDCEQVKLALARIPDRYRLVLHLRYYEDLSYEEMAETLGVPVNTVASLILRAKRLMRRELPLLGRT